jgi:hypothetical protein
MQKAIGCIALIIIIGATGANSLNKAPCISEGIIEPEVGTYRTNFCAKVHYYDVDGIKPKDIKVYINDIEYSLKFKKGTKNNGYYQTKLKLPPGQYKYYFYAEDEFGSFARYPQYGYLTGPHVTTKKAYTKPAKLEQGAVYQSLLADQTIFTFSVYFYDENQKPPQKISVVVDNIEHPMTLHKGKESDGLYIAQITLSPGPHGYYFKAIDGNNNCIKLPQYGFIRGPNFTEKKNSSPQLFDVRLEPEIGYQSECYSYEIKYLDIDRDPPALINIVINETSYPMNLKSGKPHNGIYTFRTKHLPGRYHTYYFYCEDGRGGSFRLPTRGYFYGPVVIE